MPIFFDFILGKLRYGSKVPAGSSVAATKTGTFTNANLSSGVLSITHNMGKMVNVTIKDNSGIYEGSMTITEITSNKIEVDFGGPIGAGTWTWIVTG